MRPTVLIFVALFNSILGLSILFPIFAPLGRALGLSEFEVGLLSTAYAAMQFAFGAWWGRRSERLGRKPVLLTGILGFGLTFFAFGLIAQAGMEGYLSHWPLFGLLFLSRLLGGIFSSATLPTAQAYIADITERSERTSGMAMVGAAFGLGVVFGPALGASLSHFSLLTPVYVSAAIAGLNAIFVALQLPEPERHAQVEAARTARAVVRRVWPLLSIAVASTLASVAMEQTVAFYYQDRLGLGHEETAQVVGIALVLYGLVAVFVQGFLVRRLAWPPLRMLRSGLPVALAGFVLFVFAGHYGTLTLALVLQGFGQGLAMPGATAALSLAVGDSDQGTVAGLNSSAQGFGRMLGPVVGTALYQTVSPEAPYVLSASLLVLVLLFLFGSRTIRELDESARA